VDIEADAEVVARSDGELVLPVPLDPGVDERRAALGERLFHDPVLSSDGTVSCASCHDLARGGADGQPHSTLPGREPGPVNVPTVLNVGLNFRWSWTGRWELMAQQIDVAMIARHALATSVEGAVEAARPTYAHDFERIYADGLNETNLLDALTEYLRSLTTPNAPFDRFLRGDESALDPEARRGWELFRSYGCVTCHQGVNVGGNLFQRFGVMEEYLEARPVQTRADLGRFAITEREADRHVFRVPGLRNVALTAPYFHDGSAATLEDAIQVMARYQLGRQLTPDQVHALAAFLRSLTGEQPQRHTEQAPHD
jgi:cytochrome c peroxidase